VRHGGRALPCSLCVGCKVGGARSGHLDSHRIHANAEERHGCVGARLSSTQAVVASRGRQHHGSQNPTGRRLGRRAGWLQFAGRLSAWSTSWSLSNQRRGSWTGARHSGNWLRDRLSWRILRPLLSWSCSCMALYSRLQVGETGDDLW